ncbi:MAG: protoporphyrinogen oxidase [Planctomycetes bacterium]|nr:protoporphyrinogen oxidase [Planctomycetota bacterium]
MNALGRTVVVGSGISGLTVAWELARAGREVLVLESASRVGGLVETVMRDGYRFENGPNSFPDSARDLVALAKAAGLSDRIVSADPAAQARYIYHGHRLATVPTGPSSLMKSQIFTARQKLRILAERFIPKGPKDAPESVAHFFARRFGPATARTLVDAFVSGVYAGDARKVGLRSAFPMLWEMEQEHGSILKAMKVRRKAKKAADPQGNDGSPASMTIQSFKDGMDEIVRALADSLGDRVRLGRRVTSVKPRDGGGHHLTTVSAEEQTESLEADHLVVAVPAATAGRLLAETNPMVSDLLFDIEYAGVVVLQAGFEEEQLEKLPNAFGYLVPRPTRMRTLGWLFSSKTFPGCAPEGRHALTGYIGGATDPAILDAPPEAIRHLVIGELSLALRMRRFPDPEYFHTLRHEPGLPQLDLGHFRRVRAIHGLLSEHHGLEIVGNFMGGVSINDCIRTSREAAGRLIGQPLEPLMAAGAS